MSRLFAVGVWGIIGTILIGYLPTLLAYIKGNDNKLQEFIYQTIVMILNIVVCILINILPRFVVFNIVRNVWDVVFILAWIYFLIHSISDKAMPRPR